MTCARLLTLLLFLPAAAGAQTVQPVSTDPASGIQMELRHWTQALPITGAVPMVWRIANHSTETHTWQLRARVESGYRYSSRDSGGIESLCSLTVEPGREGEIAVFLPIAPSENQRHYSYGNVTWGVDGFGLDGFGGSSRQINSFSGSGSGNVRHVFLDKALATPELKTALATSLTPRHAGVAPELVELDFAAIPADWRTFAGAWQVWLTEDVWTDMPEAGRGALLDWVSLGGQALVYADDPEAAARDRLHLPPGQGGAHPYGAGTVRVLAPEGSDGMEVRLSGDSTDPADSGLAHLATPKRYPAIWQSGRIGQLRLPAITILCFLVGFAFVVAPVNLFKLAPAGRRSRLFWTTPAISLAAGLLLAGLMIVRDGFGGTGARNVLVLLDPDRKRMAVSQEQISRTGVLRDSSFARTEADLMLPLDFSGESRGGGTLRESSDSRSGDWFSSRSIQGHWLQAVRPTRAAVEFFPAAAGGVPEVLSSLEVALDRAFVADNDGGFWTATDLRPGERQALAPVSHTELVDWLRDEALGSPGPSMQVLLDRLGVRPGWVYAASDGTGGLALETLTSIDWEHDRLLVAGPCVFH